MEKRRHRRHGKRLKVRYGEKDFSVSAFTSDVSETGMFIQAGSAPKLGTRLHIELSLEAGRVLFLEAVVQRLAVAPVQLRTSVRSGFGVRFLTGKELLAEIIPGSKESGRFRIKYETLEAFQRVYDHELQRGGLFLRTERGLAVDSSVAIELDLTFARQVLEVPCRVLSSIVDSSGKFGTSLLFHNQQEADAMLRPLAQR
jgi:Tfp pilus assembly protein PilZ